MLYGGDWGLSVKQSDAPDTSGRLVNVMIDICKKKNWGGGVCVCVCWGGGGRRKEEDGRGERGGMGRAGEIKRRGRDVGGGEGEGRKGKKILMF